MRHKWCVVPLCKNTTARNPNKIFITVPREEDTRKKWLHAIKREDMSIKSTYYCCEDHFNLEEDVENFMKFSLIGGPIYLKKNVVPHKFDCQIKITPNRKPKKSRSGKNSLTVIDGDEIVEKSFSGNSDNERSCSRETSTKRSNSKKSKLKCNKKTKTSKVKVKNDKVIRTIVGGQILEERFRESATDDSQSISAYESDNIMIDENFNFDLSKTDIVEPKSVKVGKQFSNDGKLSRNGIIQQTYRNISNDNQGICNTVRKKSCSVQASVKVADKGVQFPSVRNYKNTRDAACSPILNVIGYEIYSSSDESDFNFNFN